MLEKKIEVCIGTDRAKFLRVRLSLMVVDNGNILSEQYHSISVFPGANLAALRAINEAHLADPNGSIPGAPWPPIPDAEWEEVTAHVGVIHKPSVVAAYQAAVEARIAEELAALAARQARETEELRARQEQPGSP